MTQEVKTKATFPSVEWFNAINEIVNNDEGYKRIGTCDSTSASRCRTRASTT